jgi:Acetyltransferase (GNAT) domain
MDGRPRSLPPGACSRPRRGAVGVTAKHLVAEVVYAVAPWARGRQVAQRAVRLLCDWAMTDVGLARLEFYLEPSTIASRAVAARLGYQFEGGPLQQGSDSRHSEGHGALRAPQVGPQPTRGRAGIRRIMREAADLVKAAGSSLITAPATEAGLDHRAAMLLPFAKLQALAPGQPLSGPTRACRRGDRTHGKALVPPARAAAATSAET